MTYRPVVPGYGLIARRSQKWYAPPTGTIVGTTPMTLNRLYAFPFALAASAVFDAIGMEATVVGSAGSVVRLGVYATDLATGGPGALLVDAGTVQTSSGTGAKTIVFGSTLALEPGLYWNVAVAQVAAPTMRYMQGMALVVPYDTADAGSANQAYYKDSVSGALPNPYGTPVAFSFGPRIALRAL